MLWLTAIPTAIIFNIGFMALCYLTYEFIKYYTQTSAENLFTIAASFQLLGWIQFISYLYLLSSGWDLGFISFKTINQFSSPYFVTSTIPYWSYLGIIYCVIFIFFLLRTSYQLMQIDQFRKTANFEKDNYWKSLLSNEIKLTRFNIGYSTLIESPITFGWLDPVILLPLSICNQLSTQEIKYILLHEIAHIIRHDYLINLLAQLSHLFLYFNPFSYLFIQEINNQREMACDAWVVRQTNDPIKYSYALYGVAENATKMGANAFSIGAFKHHNALKNRILHINKVPTKSFKSFILNIVAASVCSLSLLFPTASFKLNNASNSTQASHVKTIKAAKVIITPVQLVDSKMYQQHTLMLSRQNRKAFINPIKKVTEKTLAIPYSSLVDQTLAWLKQHEQIQQYATYNEHLGDEEYTIAEKLLMHAILKNYQIKRALLNNQLSKASNGFEANTILLNSKEWNELLQYEQWTKEFLQKHPGSFTPLDSLRSF